MTGIDNAKKLSVTIGPRGKGQTLAVQLNGITPEERLAPKMARRAAVVAHGQGNSAVVYDHEHDIGYILYAKSARKFYSLGN